MKDIYIASCIPDGGIRHYIRDGEKYIYRDTRQCDRPMYMDLDGDRMHVLLRAPYPESDHSGAVTYMTASDGSLSDCGEMIDTQGVVACHLCHAFGKIYFANYLSGSVASSDGEISVHKGFGQHPKRQEAPHTHFVSPDCDGKYLLVADLGLDTVFTYDEKLNIVSKVRTPDGHGARHLAYSEDGRNVFCVNELKSTVSVFRYYNGTLTLLDTVSALSVPDYDSYAAAIRVHGELVYTSHRGADVISVMSWRDEKLRLLGNYPCGGKAPRDFLIVEDHILCANMESDNVTVLRIKGERLELTDIVLRMPSPLCIAAR